MQALRIIAPNVWGHIADATGRRERLMTITASIACVCFAAFLWVRSFAWFFAVLMAAQIFIAAQAPLAEASSVDALKGDISRYGRLRLWGSIGFIVAVGLGGPFFEQVGIAWWPYAGVVLMLLVAIMAYRLPETGHVYAHRVSPSVFGQLKRPHIALFFASAVFMVGAHSSLYAFYSLYLQGYGYSKTAIGLLWAIGVMFEVAMFFWQKRWMSRYTLSVLLIGSMAVAIGRFAVMAAFAQYVWLLIFAAALHAVTFAIHHSACMATLQRWFAGPLQARGQALYFSFSYGLGGTAGALGAAFVWEQINPAAAFWMSSGLALIGLLCMGGSLRLHRPDTSEIKPHVVQDSAVA